MENLEISIVCLSDSVEVPTYAYEGDAGLDLRSTQDLTIQPFERALVSTGLIIAIPTGYAGFIQPRSGIAFKSGLTVVNTPGLIDSKYRGEIKIAVVNLDKHNAVDVHEGDRIAQLVIIPVPHVTLKRLQALDETDRGEGGFGSSGITGTITT